MLAFSLAPFAGSSSLPSDSSAVSTERFPLGDKACTVGDTVHRAGHQLQQNTNVH